LIITDLMMPEMSGEGLVREIRKVPEMTSVPILLLSARADDEKRIELLRAGAQDFLLKPFDVEELKARVRNLTAMRLFQRKVEARSRELEELNHELEAFTYSVSHDLRAPLRAMQGFATALLEDYASKLDGTGRDYIQRVTMAAKRMDQLVLDLLEYSRVTRSSVTLRPVELGEVVRRAALQMEEEMIEKSVELQVDSSLAKVIGNDTIMVQVVANLLANAIKFVEPGVHPKVRIFTQRRERMVRLWVEDNGIGIAMEHQSRIFRLFERLHPMESYPGTGVGLAIVKKGAEKMNGVAGVESNVGKGSRFWVDLPAA
jgi:signal transduction histidine kinase